MSVLPRREDSLTILKVLAIGVLLYLFIVGIGAMGHSFELFGEDVSDRV